MRYFEATAVTFSLNVTTKSLDGLIPLAPSTGNNVLTTGPVVSDVVTFHKSLFINAKFAFVLLDVSSNAPAGIYT